MSKLRLLAVIIILGLLAIILNKIILAPASQPATSKANDAERAVDQNDPPQIVSTKPDPLNDGFVSGADPIEITFNRSIENIGEFKNRIEPKIEYKVELINDRKTAKITPTKPWPLGSTFTLYINPDTKFDGVGNWGQDKTFQFRTIRYTGV